MKNVEDVYPLCPMQEGMMFHTLLTPGTGAYVVHISSRIEGDFDIPAFKRSWQKLLERHPILRSAFLWDRVEKPLQVVRAELTLTWNEQDWRSLDHDGQQQRLHDYVWEEHRRGFDLGQAPLMRMALIHLGDRKYQFIWNYSHLLLDGWSVNVVFDELFAYYRAWSQGRELNLPRPRPYRDFIGWMQQQNKAEAEAFWKRTLHGFTAPTPLGIEEVKPGERSHSGPEQFELAGNLDRETTAKLQMIARQHRLTVSTVTQGVWTRLLSCYSRTEDVVFGVTVTGRPVSLRGVESVVGLLVNTLPMRVRVRHEEQLMAWLKEIQDHQVEIRKYEASSLVKVRDWSGVPGNQPLFESFVVFENHPVAKGVQELHGNVRFTSGRSLENATYPLVYLTEPGEQLPIRIMFDHSRFNP